MKPYKFESFLKTTIWGGEQIAAFKGIDTDLHNVGESWEISDFPGQESVVASGEDKGLNLSALVEKYKEQLELRELLLDMADKLCERTGGTLA